MGAQKFIIVAIDGGAASGKSSTSRRLAERFNLLHVDTGSFYRHLTSVLLQHQIAPVDNAILRAALAGLKLGTQIEGRSAKMLVDGKAGGDEIRGTQVNEQVSHYAALPPVRQALLAYQRGQTEVARRAGLAGLVMEGRDIGSVIFPDADFRFFLHADPAERVRRRAAEGRQDAIAERDRLDSSRKTAPLTCPPGATDVDTTHLNLEQVVEKIATMIGTELG